MNVEEIAAVWRLRAWIEQIRKADVSSSSREGVGNTGVKRQVRGGGGSDETGCCSEMGDGVGRWSEETGTNGTRVFREGFHFNPKQIFFFFIY